MKHLFFILLLLPALAWGQRFQLAAPHLTVDSVFFRKQAQVELAFDLDGSTIRYTTDGTYPNDSAAVYKKAIEVTNSGTVRAKAMHPDFLPGNAAEKTLFKINFLPDSMGLQPAPDSLYKGKGAATLFDLRKGDADLKSGRWLGFRTDTVVVETRCKKPVSLKTLQLSTLFDAGAWIFPPKRIEVYGASGKGNWQTVGVWNAREGFRWKDLPSKYDQFQKVIIRPLPVDRLQIRIVPFGPLPEGHPGAGQAAWLFLDEIIFM
ncbi:MAG: chitobiase/beta-hexosaminidase C-terminal domain-containing protein [Saprospiraceae bacterium]|nr:chitobiase/beta-hexosaminidase C-terminal domain-containing protein [Saprospiraceae bacterium]